MPVIKFNVPGTSSTAGTAVDTQRFKPWKGVQFYGVTGGGSLKVQGSNDGTNFTDIGDPVTTDGLVSLVTMAAFMRIYVTTAKSGATVYMSTHDISVS